MAAMTRDDFVTELQSRGWDKFDVGEVQKYVNWALQLVTGKSRWAPSQSKTSAIAVPTTGIVAQTTVDAVENIREIQRVYYTSATEVSYINKLEPMDEDVFFETWYPEILRGSALGFNSDAPDRYFLWDENIYFLPLPAVARTCEVHYIKMPQTFSGAGAASGLPERFDKIILKQAECICLERGREMEAYMTCEAIVARMIEEEQALEAMQWREEPNRIAPYR